MEWRTIPTTTIHLILVAGAKGEGGWRHDGTDIDSVSDRRVRTSMSWRVIVFSMKQGRTDDEHFCLRAVLRVTSGSGTVAVVHMLCNITAGDTHSG